MQARVIAAVLAIGGGLAVAPASAQGLWRSETHYQARITTDSAQYCATLLSRVTRERAQVQAPAQWVDHLTAEGRQMCDDGLIRPGITRLRRALLLLDKLR